MIEILYNRNMNNSCFLIFQEQGIDFFHILDKEISYSILLVLAWAEAKL